MMETIFLLAKIVFRINLTILSLLLRMTAMLNGITLMNRYLIAPLPSMHQKTVLLSFMTLMAIVCLIVMSLKPIPLFCQKRDTSFLSVTLKLFLPLRCHKLIKVIVSNKANKISGEFFC